MRDPATTLYLIDSSIYIFRAWQTLPSSIVGLDGHPANAVHGFADFLLQVLTRTNAHYAVCAFDKSRARSARKAIYPAYKASRSPAPEALKRQFPLCQKLVDYLGIKQYSHELYEADDIIGTLAATASVQGMPTCIVSADKDLMQFIGEDDQYWNFARNQTFDARSIENRLGVKPSQIADMLALSGDKVDNIPGIPGVGASTAAKLLKRWGTLDNLFKHADEVAGMKFRGAATVSALLREHQDTVRLARRLTGLLHVDGLPDNTQELARGAPNVTALLLFLTELGMTSEVQERLLQTVQARLVT